MVIMKMLKIIYEFININNNFIKVMKENANKEINLFQLEILTL